jgi:hypothetical protein
MIEALVERKNAAPENSAERKLCERQLIGLRYSHEDAGGIIEDLDPIDWGSTARRLPATPAKHRQVLSVRTAGSRRGPHRA